MPVSPTDPVGITAPRTIRVAVVVQVTGVQIAPTALGPLRVQGRSWGLGHGSGGLVAWGLGGHSGLCRIGLWGSRDVTSFVPRGCWPEAGWLHRKFISL